MNIESLRKYSLLAFFAVLVLISGCFLFQGADSPEVDPPVVDTTDTVEPEVPSDADFPEGYVYVAQGEKNDKHFRGIRWAKKYDEERKGDLFAFQSLHKGFWVNTAKGEVYNVGYLKSIIYLLSVGEERPIPSDLQELYEQLISAE